ncbi:hypothetical protein AK812_SmicGene41034 [Symbiodinium microadriaticum]|uniref:Uncharacterized protein n=1 Tax=Symbiodinium microadriaticum TaxID=2951 RepID=A0A1Q9C752_SYMMI|nr:hypothetical protein AK812_SmicGene41034 [Symbiodinium microadriaticum]CAE7222568.1 unnamed protein product [Symbiodinium sp. KB8]
MTASSWVPKDPNHFALQQHLCFFRQWAFGHVFRRVSHGRGEDAFAGADLPRLHEKISDFLGAWPGFHFSQVSSLEHFAMLQDTWLERFLLYHEARGGSSAQRRAERFKYMGGASGDDSEEEAGSGADGPVDILGDDVPGEEEEDAYVYAERMEQPQYPVSLQSLDEVLFREQDWKKALRRQRNPTSIHESLQKLHGVVEAVGGVPRRAGAAVASTAHGFVAAGVDPSNTRSTLEAQQMLLQSVAMGQEDDGRREEDHDGDVQMASTEMEDTDPFIVQLNSQDLAPKDYAWRLVVEHKLTCQQIYAVVPAVRTIQEMYESRTNPAAHLADGQASRPCRCLWLGAGGSGKTYSYTKVLRPMFRRYFGKRAYVATAPTHAAARLLGLEARTLHKVANVTPQSKLDRRSMRAAQAKRDQLESELVHARATVLDELSMSPSDVYHSAGYRCSLLRQERLSLDLNDYLQEWYGRMDIGLQLGDFFQLRPTGQKSLCEWLDTDGAVEVEANNEETESNVSELGRLMFKYSIQHVVHFTGTGRFSTCQSGKDLVAILEHMRAGTAMPDALWGSLQSRELRPRDLSSNDDLQQRFFGAHWGAFAWDQVARLQQIRAGHEAAAAGQTLYYVQAVDQATEPEPLSPAESQAALQVVNMGTSGYLMGMVPLFLGMQASLRSCLCAAAVVLRYLPQAVLVEVEDEEYKQFRVPEGGLPAGHFLIEPLTSPPWKFKLDTRKISVKRRQASYQSPADYVLAVYVMLSRARKLEDLFIVDMPDRDIFEGALRRLNPTLVARMEELQRMSAESLRGAKKDAAWLKWSISNQ